MRSTTLRPSDYTGILEILERAYDDPNKVYNARQKLYGYKQTNKDFSTFIAEFQRLALEGDMTDESLTPLLEQSISSELRTIIKYRPPPNRNDFYELRKHLQVLKHDDQFYSTPRPQTTRPTTPRLNSPLPT